MGDLESILCDVRYAVGQIKRFGDVGRALDALERIEERVGRCLAEGLTPTPVVPAEEWDGAFAGDEAAGLADWPGVDG